MKSCSSVSYFVSDRTGEMVFLIGIDDPVNNSIVKRTHVLRLSEMVACADLHPLLEPALACCESLPANLTVKEKLSFLQLEV